MRAEKLWPFDSFYRTFWTWPLDTIPLHLFSDPNNWKIISLVEIGVEKDLIVHSSLLVEFSGKLVHYSNNRFILEFTKIPKNDDSEKFVINIIYESPLAEDIWENIKSKMCKNCK